MLKLIIFRLKLDTDRTHGARSLTCGKSQPLDQQINTQQWPDSHMWRQVPLCSWALQTRLFSFYSLKNPREARSKLSLSPISCPPLTFQRPSTQSLSISQCPETWVPSSHHTIRDGCPTHWCSVEPRLLWKSNVQIPVTPKQDATRDNSIFLSLQSVHTWLTKPYHSCS